LFDAQRRRWPKNWRGRCAETDSLKYQSFDFGFDFAAGVPKLTHAEIKVRSMLTAGVLNRCAQKIRGGRCAETDSLKYQGFDL
jgi:hypothetical protein